MNKRIFWFFLLLPILAVGLYLYFSTPEETPELPLPPAPVVESEPEPAIRYPVPEPVPAIPDDALELTAEPEEMLPEPETEEPLPALEDSDGLMTQVYEELFGEPALERWFNLANPVRHLVATIDNAGREKMAVKQRPLKPVEGAFLVEGNEERMFIHPDNSRRYLPYMRLAEALDLERMAERYFRFYPLFQQAYEELGYPDAYFNDRLVEVIDLLLVTPEPRQPVLLVRPHVLYEYADPELEALTAGQKILVRVGPENAARLKARLRALRALLVSGAPSG
ncbi:MAG: DUF3014 domain-containing protein [Gammaproteobacteria bacterium]|nr:DUF3014 domain-containing protein [Gammaproteobacteria bacterium]